ncbi:Hypothetical predicted protein [Paramuricea clavata]|uniref:Uncharacterized protein n=1 Tax=Paramuricea clavata TaxID=317549 RepID=A0A6S7IQ60_PARCT|nr:Hypothetical predicted protein [Paramuricea clavata]
MAVNQVGGAAGSAFGKGCVYVMTYTVRDRRKTINYYKIGCTSREPNVRLQEIQDSEINNITLVGSVTAKKMNGAETAAQNAVKVEGLVKDPARGGATDWFKGSLTPQKVLDVVRTAVDSHNDT